MCFFQSAEKFKSRYATFGFNDTANLDDGDMWPTAFALTEVTAAVEKTGRRPREARGQLTSRSPHREVSASGGVVEVVGVGDQVQEVLGLPGLVV